MSVKGTVFSLATVAVMFSPSPAFGNISGTVYQFDWTYGNPALATNPVPVPNTDSVYAYGTLTAESTSTTGVYDITGGTGTRIDSTGVVRNGIYAVTIEPCAAAVGLTCSIRVASGTDFIYDNLLIANGGSTFVLDGNGADLFETPSRSVADAQYFNVWGNGNGTGTEFYADSNNYIGIGLNNQFTATLAESSTSVQGSPTPEPGFYAVLAVGLIGLAFFQTRRPNAR